MDKDSSCLIVPGQRIAHTSSSSFPVNALIDSSSNIFFKMARLGITFFILFIFFFHASQSANILFFWGYSGYSHRITVWPLIEKLASNHNVTFFSCHPPKIPYSHPNITEITSNVFIEIGMSYHPADIRINEGIAATDHLWFGYLESGLKLTEILTQKKEFVQWVDDASFDLVVVNTLFNDMAYAMAWKWKVPTILYSPTSLFSWWGETYGIPEENYPEFHFHLPSNMTFFQEVVNTFIPLFWHAYRQYYYLPKIDSMVRTAFKVPDMPPLLEMDQRNAIIFTNTHFSEEYPRSLPPNIIPVGGQHCTEDTKPLPADIQKFVDQRDNIIYFSFGTYMKLPLLPERIKKAIFGAIKQFPNTGFVLKWSGGDVPKDIPKNVFTADWLSQQDLLANPKVRAFITHGGLLSTQEAIFHGIPMIVFPIFAEQDYNAQRIHHTERGIMMEIGELTEEKFVAAIREILQNKKYKENVVQTSRIFRDRPQKAVDTSVWWVEYVLRHKSTPFLRAVGTSRTWYQRRMLHVWGFVALVAFVFIGMSFYFLKFSIFAILKCLRQRPSSVKMKSQ